MKKEIMIIGLLIFVVLAGCVQQQPTTTGTEGTQPSGTVSQQKITEAASTDINDAALKELDAISKELDEATNFSLGTETVSSASTTSIAVKAPAAPTAPTAPTR